MERAVVVDFNIGFLDKVEVSRNAKEKKKSKKSRMLDKLDDNVSASPDVITLKITLRNKRNGSDVKRKSNRRLRFVFEEEENEVGVVEDETRKVKKSKKRRLEVTPDEEIVSGENEETLRKKKKKRSKKSSSPSTNSNNDENNDAEYGKESEDTSITRKKKHRKKSSRDVEEKNDDVNDDSVPNIVEETVSNDFIERNGDEHADETIGPIPSTNDSQMVRQGIPQQTTVGKYQYSKSQCQECGDFYSNLERHYRYSHPEFSKEDVLTKIGGSHASQRPLKSSKRPALEHKKIICPICRNSFGNLPRHLTAKHGINVRNLAAKETVRHSDNALDTILSKFKVFMIDKKQGAISKRCAASYMCRLRPLLMSYIPPDGRFTTDICANLDKLDEKNGFFEKVMDTANQSTVLQYFCAVNKFISFIAQHTEFWWFDDINRLETCRLILQKLRQRFHAKKKEPAS